MLRVKFIWMMLSQEKDGTVSVRTRDNTVHGSRPLNGLLREWRDLTANKK
jgi:hypothetical protein